MGKCSSGRVCVCVTEGRGSAVPVKEAAGLIILINLSFKMDGDNNWRKKLEK